MATVKLGTTLKLAAYASGVWATIFAAVHLYWLLGGGIGLPKGRSVFDSTPL
ncbi:MAG: hypothetical protein ACRDPW_10320 [Mycobacteriales bacterium]